MKHVFIINSHTTYLTSLGIIEYLSLSPDNIVMIYTRHYNNCLLGDKFFVVDFSEEDEICTKQAQKGGAKLGYCIQIVDNCVRNYIKTQYCLYFPHLQMNISQLFFTNKLCVKGSYVQEGAFCQPQKYIQKFELLDKFKNFIINNVVIRSKRFTRPLGWYQPDYFDDTRDVNSFSFDNEFFKGLPCKNHLVKWPKLKIDLILDIRIPIFIFDGFINNGIVEKDFYMAACKHIIGKYGKEKNYVKYHPAQDSIQRKMISDIFRNEGKICIDLNDSIPFEIVLCSYRNLTIVGFSSSLLKYAYDIGHTVYANDDILKDSKLFSIHNFESGFPYLSDIFKKS